MQSFSGPEIALSMSQGGPTGAPTKVPGVAVPSESLVSVIHQYQGAHEIHKMNVI